MPGDNQGSGSPSTRTKEAPVIQRFDCPDCTYETPEDAEHAYLSGEMPRMLSSGKSSEETLR